MSIVPDKSRIPMGRETPINSDTVKPTWTMRGTPSKAVDTALGYLWQDYSERPHEWRHSARSYMSAILRHNNILNNVTIDYLLERTWLMVEENEWLGNRRMLMRCFGTVCRNYEHEKQVAKQAKREQTPLVEKLNWERKVKHPELFNPDGSQRGYYENGTVPDTTGIATSVEDFVARQRTAPPVAPEPSEDKLDTWLPRWSAVKEPTLEKQLFSAAGHFKRELHLIKPDASEGEEMRSALQSDLEEYIEAHGINQTCMTLQSRLDYLKENKAVTAPTTEQTDELTTHWSATPENMAVIAKNLEAEAYDLQIPPNEILTEAEKTIGRWTDFFTGREALAAVKIAWKEKIVQKADNLNESAAVGPDRPASQGTGLPESVASSDPAKPKTQPKPQSNASFKKATKKDSKLRLALGGVPGGGKTYTALQIATEMFPNGKIAVLDTEQRSAAKYADIFNFDVLEITDDFRPEKYIEAIHLAEDEGYDVLILDSFSHEWAAQGGILDIVDHWKESHPTRDGKEDGRAAWGHASPRHNDLVQTILQSKIHIIATMRCKWKTVAARDENKRPISVKVIGDLEQRQKIEYEFDIVALCDQNQDLIIDKTRCTELRGYKGNCAGKEVARRIAKWLNIA